MNPLDCLMLGYLVTEVYVTTSYAREELWRRNKECASETNNAADICLSVYKISPGPRQHSHPWL
jgi:hypothetical protein